MDFAARQADLGGVSYTFRSCPPLRNGQWSKVEQADENCASLRRSFFAGLAAPSDIPQTVIVQARWTLMMTRTRFDNGEGGIESGEEADWRFPFESRPFEASMAAAFADTVTAILRSGRRVILVYPSPEMGWDLPTKLVKTYLSSGMLRAEDASTSYVRHLARNQAAIRALDRIGEHPNLVRVKPVAVLCNTFVKERCVGHFLGESLYFDDDHLSNAGSQLVVEKILRALRDAKPAPATYPRPLSR